MNRPPGVRQETGGSLRCWCGLERSFREKLQVPGALESANDRP
jgi:hypothetical protein